MDLEIQRELRLVFCILVADFEDELAMLGPFTSPLFFEVLSHE
jgi:hypothetical protein